MRPLHDAINTTLDGCCDHTAMTPDEEAHLHWATQIEGADAPLSGRVTYEMPIRGHLVSDRGRDRP